MHCGPLIVHHWTKRAADGPFQGRRAGRADRNEREDPDHSGGAEKSGYATGQFGKNHLGDLNKMLPTDHGFDEFFGNLYHLNAEEEPEDPDYPPKDFPKFTATTARAA